MVLPLAGKLSDELGRKRVFLGAVAISTVASFLCGIAPNVETLIVFRLLQASDDLAAQACKMFDDARHHNSDHHEIDAAVSLLKQ